MRGDVRWVSAEVRLRYRGLRQEVVSVFPLKLRRIMFLGYFIPWSRPTDLISLIHIQLIAIIIHALISDFRP